MIPLIGLFGVFIFSLASLLVGVHILRIAAKSRGLPEMTLGLSLFLAGGIGTLAVVPQAVSPGMNPTLAFSLGQLANVANHLGFALLFVFVWRVFRPNAAWAKALFIFCTTLVVAGAIGIALHLKPGVPATGPEAYDGVWFLASMSARFIGYSWAAIESLSYYSLLRKRIPLGLADPETVVRFLHWGISTAAVVLIWVNLILEQFVPETSAYLSASRLISAVLGLIVAGTLWLAFTPSRLKSAAGSESTDAPIG